jgi:hypothetical protein
MPFWRLRSRTATLGRDQARAGSRIAAAKARSRFVFFIINLDGLGLLRI